MNRIALGEFDRAFVVYRVAGDIEQATQNTLPDGHRDWTTRVVHAHSALQAFGGRHRDRAHAGFAEMLLHFKSQLGRAAVDLEVDLERVINFRHAFLVGEFDVHDRPDNLNDISFIHKS